MSMKKFLNVVDPRKSRSKGSLAEEMSSGISVEGISDLFSTDKLAQAVKAASALSVKSGSSVIVSLPPTQVPVKSGIVVTGDVILLGHVKNDGVEANASCLLIEPGAQFVYKSGSSSFSNVIISTPKGFKSREGLIQVGPEATLAITECLLDTAADAENVVLGLAAQGNVQIKGCHFNNWKIVMEEAGNGMKLESSHFTNSLDKRPGEKGSTAISVLKSDGEFDLNGVEIDGFAAGIVFDSSAKGNATARLHECKVKTIMDCIFVDGVEVTLENSTVTSKTGNGLVANGQKTFIVSRKSTFENCKFGVTFSDKAKGELNEAVISNPGECGLRLFNESSIKSVHLKVNSAVISTKEVTGVSIKSGSTCSFEQFEADHLSGFAIAIENANSAVTGVNFNVTECTRGGVHVSDGGIFEAEEVTISDCQGNGVEVVDPESNIELKKFNVSSGGVALFGDSCKNVNVSNFKIVGMQVMGFLLTDCSGNIANGHINNQTTNAPGIHIIYDKSFKEKMLLQECKCQSCEFGVKIEQKVPQSPSSRMPAETDGPRLSVEVKGQNKKRNERKSAKRRTRKSVRLSRCELENCSFIMCKHGFSVDNARAALKGCSFIMSTQHSVFIKSQVLKEGKNLRKQSKLKIRWPNFVEPHIDNGAALSNDHNMLTSVTHEKPFYGSANFEPVMYLPVLTERVKQARSLFGSTEYDGESKARVIMKSVNHMLILLKDLQERMVNTELPGFPSLGMFAATFQLSLEKKGMPGNTLIVMKDLFASWANLTRPQLFDDALSALNEAFNKKQVDEDLYDEWVTPLEEMQRVCYVNSKYNRRRDYLLETSKDNPLAAWYFLDKEDPKTVEGARLRDEVLKFLAKDDEENRVNKDNFHGSWVAQWAVQLLGDSFTTSRIPEDYHLRRAWGDKLLDQGDSQTIMDEYRRVADNQTYNTEVDQLMKFEALCMHEDAGNKLSPDDYNSLRTLLGGDGYTAATKAAAKLFKGQGALPGYLRRAAEKASSPEALLEILSPVHEDANLGVKSKRMRVILAVMGHYYYRDNMSAPKVHNKRKLGYETCPTCLVQKLQPWNELHLSACQHNHRFCRACIKNSMSTGDNELWGKCPGVIKEGESCSALGTRKEMELAGMDESKIYNILNSRVIKNLQSIDGWKPCDSPGCIGGRSNVVKEFYTCWLCTKTVTPDGGISDPTVARRLLRGFDGTTVPRGEGLFRECYHCAVIYEKGNACSTITCVHCQKPFSMTWGPENITHRFDEEGVGPQRYVPKKEGKLWELGVFKTKKGEPLPLGKCLNEEEAQEVVRRAKFMLQNLEG